MPITDLFATLKVLEEGENSATSLGIEFADTAVPNYSATEILIATNLDLIIMFRETAHSTSVEERETIV